MNNLLERAFGGDPNAADSALLPATDDTAPLLSIIYRKSNAATDLTFSIEESPDLAAPWVTAAGSSSLLGNDGSAQRFRFTAPAGSAGSKFLRVRVTGP
jgi:hypothetical protein